MADKQKVSEKDVARVKAANPGADVTVEDGRIVVSGVTTMTGDGGIGGRRLAQDLEQAMSAAVERALADGVSINDSPRILAYKHHARAVVLREHGRDVEVPPLPDRGAKAKDATPD